VLRKKSHQATFLHVYHHAGMIAMSYVQIKFLSGGGHGLVLGLINSYVHVAMYIYYICTALNVDVSKSWKKFLTQIQMVSDRVFHVFHVVERMKVEQSTEVLGCLQLTGLMMIKVQVQF
jgi:GNS1/SUR4 family